MKLLLCVKCNDVFKLLSEYKECSCGACGGQYIDEVNAKVWGTKDKHFVLGFANSSLVAALREQITSGDSDEMMRYGGKMTPAGRDFTAFIIPNAADSVERVEQKFEPVPHQKSRWPY